MRAMSNQLAGRVAVTPLGGPTVLLQIDALRFVIDPTFDDPGSYPIGDRVLTKTHGATVSRDQLGPIDAVLLSHDQHPDNLDHAGRDFLGTVPLVLTTTTAAERLDVPAQGLAPWESTKLDATVVTAVPAQHGPDGTEALTGPVIGFMLTTPDAPTIYISGDNASLGVVQAIAERLPTPDIAVLFAGAARTPLIDGYLTLTSEQAAQAAEILGKPRILPVHTDGWAHFTENAGTLKAAFKHAQLDELLIDPTPGTRTVM